MCCVLQRNRSKQPPTKFELGQIGTVSARQIKRDLTSVLRKGEKFDLEVVQKEVGEYLASIMMPKKEEEMFLQAFAEGKYCPELIFEDRKFA